MWQGLYIWLGPAFTGGNREQVILGIKAQCIRLVSQRRGKQSRRLRGKVHRGMARYKLRDNPQIEQRDRVVIAVRVCVLTPVEIL